MTFYDKCTSLSEVICVPKDGYRTHKEQLNIQVKDSLNLKQNNKSLLEFVVMTMINKKIRQKVDASIGKIGIEFHLSHYFVF